MITKALSECKLYKRLTRSIRARTYFPSLHYHAMHVTLVVYSQEDVASFFATFFICPSIPPHLSPRTKTSLSFSFAFIKYKQFHTFCPTPERPAEHIFTTQHSGFCQLFSAPASRHFADSPS